MKRIDVRPQRAKTRLTAALPAMTIVAGWGGFAATMGCSATDRAVDAAPRLSDARAELDSVVTGPDAAPADGAPAEGVMNDGSSATMCTVDEDCGAARCCVEATAPYGPSAPDDPCASSVASRCANSCPVAASQSSSALSMSSSACAGDADCAGVTNSFGVPYAMCCRFDDRPGLCVSETYAQLLEQKPLGWACHGGVPTMPECKPPASNVSADAGPAPPDARSVPVDSAPPPPCRDLSGTWNDISNAACWGFPSCTIAQTGCSMVLTCGDSNNLVLSGTVNPYNDSFQVSDPYTVCSGSYTTSKQACRYQEPCLTIGCTFCPGPVPLKQAAPSTP